MSTQNFPRNKPLISITHNILYVIVFLFTNTTLAAQHSTQAVHNATHQSDEYIFWNENMLRIAQQGTQPDWVDFLPEATLQPHTLFVDHAIAFGLGTNDAMHLVRTEDDVIEHKHYLFQQYHKGYEVYGAQYRVHTNEVQRVYSANGTIIRNLNNQAVPSLSEGQALAAAMKAHGAPVYRWQIVKQKSAEEQDNINYVYDAGQEMRDAFPHGDLVWVHPVQANRDPRGYQLAWRFDLYVPGGVEDMRLFIDAMTGEVIKSVPLSHSCFVGNGNTTWHGFRFINTSASLFAGYFLRDECNVSATGIVHTKNRNLTFTASEYFDDDNNWNDGGTISTVKQVGISTQWAGKATLNYFYGVHNRRGHTGQAGMGTGLDLSEFHNNVIIGGTRNNACYCGGNFVFGPGDSDALSTDDWNTLDIVAHEVTHGVISYSSDLEYSYESGALNESFADIFGVAVEQWMDGSYDYGTWAMGEDRGPAIRDISDPNVHNHPDTYLGFYWYFGAFDNGGVHTNSGVMNHWFYLLSQGGSGSNNNGTDYEVQGIGIEKARAIAYRNMTVYMTVHSQYLDAREGAIRAANDLYGSCSEEALATAEAWRAVGVGPLHPLYWRQICADITTSLFGSAYIGIESVTAGGFCTTTVNPSSYNTFFRAGKYVDLKTGFTALAGSNFTAQISDCAVAYYREPNPAYTEPQGEINDPLASIGQVSQLSLYPNPATSSTLLELTGAEESPYQVSLFDLTGRRHWMENSQTASGNVLQHSIPLGGVPAGIYVVQLEQNGHMYSERLVVLDQ